MPQITNKIEKFKLYVKSRLERSAKKKVMPLGKSLTSNFGIGVASQSKKLLAGEYATGYKSFKRIMYNAELPDMDYEVESDYLQKIDQASTSL
jgi:hypothetical protein